MMNGRQAETARAKSCCHYRDSSGSRRRLPPPAAVRWDVREAVRVERAIVVAILA
jgi:hypothetical protein